MKKKVSKVEVIEGPLYEKYGEDSMVVCYDLWIEATVGDIIYRHKHVFRGMGETPEGFACPNFNAKPDAHRLAERVRKRGVVNLKHWIKVFEIPGGKKHNKFTQIFSRDC
jgi:hypothetical protein